ncbi:transposase [Chroococcidiopsis sp [FACHB-1243]]|uniref:transposase n=1 Tax=Chroococcidiopsis sp. [FACHB-1243] TaxID=2692781 RepID=UPI0018EF729C|nr:transposase [Chroococcidiopsis sp. [FACHB-1243]]
MHKGHKDFKTVVSNVDRGELLEILDTHKSEEIIEMLMQQPTEVREAVEEVSIDMWGGFSRIGGFRFPQCRGSF